jgi:hypothetical protein
MSTPESRAKHTAWMRGWRAANPERRKENDRRRNAAHPERRRATNAKSYAAHREERLARRREQYAINAEMRRSEARARRAANPEKTRAATRATHLTKYGITVAEYETMLAEQCGVCWICGGMPRARRLAVDHEHESQAVRGLLCHECNIGLGNFSDSEELLTRAIEYLRRSRLPRLVKQEG